MAANDSDFAELDEWLGTLEELQKGLQQSSPIHESHQNKSPYSSFAPMESPKFNNKLESQKSPSTFSPTPSLTTTVLNHKTSSPAPQPPPPPSHFIENFPIESSNQDYDNSSHYYINQEPLTPEPTPPPSSTPSTTTTSATMNNTIRSNGSSSYSPRTSFCPSNNGTVVRNANYFSSHPQQQISTTNNNITQEPGALPALSSSFVSPPASLLRDNDNKPCPNEERKDIAASKELDTLLQELTAIEQQMHALENEDGFTKRYSLASSTGKISDRMSPVPSLHGCTPTEIMPGPLAMPNISARSLDSGIQESGISPNGSSENSSHPLVTMHQTHSLSSTVGHSVDNNNKNHHDFVDRQRNSSSFSQDGNRLSELNSPTTTTTTTAATAAALLGVGGGGSSDDVLRLKKVVVRVFHQDKTTKALMVDESMNIRDTCNILIEKNFCRPNIKLSLVEKVPLLKMEHCFEDHETLAECILSWPQDSSNMIFFEEREDKFGLFLKPQDWLGPDIISKDVTLDTQVEETIFGGKDVYLPEWKDYLYIKKPTDKTWTRKYCIVRNSGLYASKKKKSTAPGDLIRVMLLDESLRLYTTTGGWTKLKAPTPYGFAFKNYSQQDPRSNMIFYFCASDEEALKKWITLLRLAKYGRQLLGNYRSGQRDMELIQNKSMDQKFGRSGRNSTCSTLPRNHVARAMTNSYDVTSSSTNSCSSPLPASPTAQHSFSCSPPPPPPPTSPPATAPATAFSHWPSNQPPPPRRISSSISSNSTPINSNNNYSSSPAPQPSQPQSPTSTNSHYQHPSSPTPPTVILYQQQQVRSSMPINATPPPTPPHQQQHHQQQQQQQQQQHLMMSSMQQKQFITDQTIATANAINATPTAAATATGFNTSFSQQ